MTWKLNFFPLLIQIQFNKAPLPTPQTCFKHLLFLLMMSVDYGTSEKRNRWNPGDVEDVL